MLLYAPQLVGYARIALIGGALLSGTAQPHLTAGLFLANFLLDGLDGYLARKLQQARRWLARTKMGQFCRMRAHNSSDHARGHACMLCRPRRLVLSWM